MILCTLVCGADAARRETAIAGLIPPLVSVAVILEGVHAGTPMLQARETAPALWLSIIGPGCPHCDDGRVLRVTLDRMLRRRPAHLYLGLADATHLPHLQQYLGAVPYADLVRQCPPVILQ